MIKKVWEHIKNKDEIRKVDTELYPDPVSSRSKNDLPTRARGLLFNDIEQCTGCGDCSRVCPTKCIKIKTQDNTRTDRVWVSQFDIDYSNCVFCGRCVEVCEPNSLIQTKEIQASSKETSSLVLSFGRGEL